jgi:hypothetical protein
MSKPYTVKIRLRPENVFPDLHDWLEQHGIFYGEHWSWTKNGWSCRLDSGEYDAEFDFRQPEHATLFALRWSQQ